MTAIDDGAMQDKAGARINDLVKWLRRHPIKNIQDAADALESQSAELTRLRERNAELERERDAAAAVDGDAQWNAAIEAAAKIADDEDQNIAYARPKDSNADAWHLFLTEYLDARANSPSGLTFMAVQIAEAIDDAERRGTKDIEVLRSIISKCANALGNGAAISHDCSIAFMGLLPSEIGLHVASLIEDRDGWKERAKVAESERDSLRKALDDRYAADLKAAKAIFAETGRTSGFPSVKEIVEWYVAEVERLERDDLGERLKITQMAESVALEDRDFYKAERDSLRTKLDRAKEALMKLETYLEEFDVEGGPVWINSCWHIVRAVLAELSADAPAQPPVNYNPAGLALVREKLGRISSNFSDDPRSDADLALEALDKFCERAWRSLPRPPSVNQFENDLDGKPSATQDRGERGGDL